MQARTAADAAEGAIVPKKKPVERSKRDGLTPRQRAFIKAYLGEAHGCATVAARIAGYASPNPEGARLLANARVAAAIAKKPERPDIASPDQVRKVISDILTDPDSTKAERMKAAEVLAKILPGLSAPTKLEHSGRDGAPIKVQARTYDLAKLSDVQLDALEAALATPEDGQDPDPADEG